jgi:hypothetical protein
VKLIIEVECEGSMCGGCSFQGRYVYGETGYQNEWRTCSLFENVVRDRVRLDVCRAAEEKANALERRYAELVEDVSRRTDQAAADDKLAKAEARIEKLELDLEAIQDNSA